jgi:two-component system, OmpR family, response regulator RegX3
MINKPIILFVTDDILNAHFWSDTLQTNGLNMVPVTISEDPLSLVEKTPFDLVLIDSLEIDAVALGLCQQIRNQLINPILFMSEEVRESQLVKMYQAGADETVIKPIGPRLLLAKINAWLHRSWNVPVAVLEKLCAGSFCLEPSNHLLTIEGGCPIKLTNLEFRLLHLLMSNPGRCIDTQMIVDRVWGFSGEGDATVLKHLVYRLRRKIEPNPSQPTHLQTYLGEGYAFHP